MNGQISITLVIDYEYEGTEQLDEIEIATRATGLITPNFVTIEDGLSIDNVEAFYEDTNIMNY